MAGSRKWFVYTTDDGQDFALNMDESNTEAVNGGVQDYPNAGVAVNALPRNIKPRTARFVNPAGTISREIVCLTTTIYNGIPANLSSVTDQVSGETLFLKSKTGEKITLAFGIDTGLQDGDAT